MWVYHTKCIKRVGGFPNKVMVLVATLGRGCPLRISFVNVEI